jgi:hypothetical protein
VLQSIFTAPLLRYRYPKDPELLIAFADANFFFQMT